VFFSVAFIYLANLALISTILVAVSPGVSFWAFLQALLAACAEVSHAIVQVVGWLAAAAGRVV